MKNVFSRYRRFFRESITFSLVMYSLLTAILTIAVTIYALFAARSSLPVLLLILVSSVSLTYLYLKQFPIGSAQQANLEQIMSPNEKIKIPNYQAGVFGLITTLTLHVNALLMPNSILGEIVLNQTQKFGYTFMYFVLIIVIPVVLLYVFTQLARLIFKSKLIPPKPSIAILVATLAITGLLVWIIHPLAMAYGNEISQIGLFVIGSIPLGIATILLFPQRFTN